MPDTLEPPIIVSPPSQPSWSSNKPMMIVVFIVIVVVGITIGFAIMKKPSSQTTQNPSDMPAPTSMASVRAMTNLTLSPSTKSVKVGEEFPVIVSMVGESIQAVDIVLTYDPTVLKATTIKEGGVFPQFLRKNITDGKVIVSASVDPVNPQVLPSSGQIVTINFVALKADPAAKIEFDTKESILAKSGQNLLKNAVGGTYEIQ